MGSKFGLSDDDFDISTVKHTSKDTHKSTQYEKKDVRMQILIAPRTAEILKDLKKRGQIKSANALINELLEKYFDENGHDVL